MSFFKKISSKIKAYFFAPIYTKLTILNDAILDSRFDEVKKNILHEMPENMVKYGQKCYSAGEEDGIIAAIFNKIKPDEKVFLEIGSGFGLENNTHFMLLSGWKGTWVDGNNQFIKTVSSKLGGSTFSKLLIKNCFVDSNNIKQLFSETLVHFNTKEIDFFSIDIDGNDYAVTESMFSKKIFPKVICVEYNGKYPYPCKVKVTQEETFVWNNDDYMGVSLGAWVSLFSSYQYTLLCCDATGNNAFFIRNEFAHLFQCYSPEQLYQPARYYLVRKRIGHSASLKFLKDVLHND